MTVWTAGHLNGPTRFQAFTAELAKYPAGLYSLNPPAIEEAISQVEYALSVSLPGDYREFLQLFDGGQIFGNAVRFFPTSKVFDHKVDLVDANTNFRWPGIPATTLVIGDYFFGDSICLNLAPPGDDTPNIYIWDHELGQPNKHRTWPSLERYLEAEMADGKRRYTYTGKTVAPMRRFVNSLAELVKPK